jgi:signal transduction histidine kinase
MKRWVRNWNLVQNVIYGKSVSRFEDRLLLLSTFLITIILALSIIFNVLLGLKLATILCSIIGMVAYFLLYLYGRFLGHGRFYFWLTSIISILFIDSYWFFNFASHGPLLPLLLVFYSFLILIFEKKYYLLISFLIFINLFCLYFIELNFFEAIGNYQDNKSRMLDNYLGMMLNLLVIFSIVSTIKKNYVNEFDRAKMSDQLKSSFLANMSHEIRTPLNAIVGFSSLMSDEDISIREKNEFQILIQKNSDYLLTLIEDIIDVSKIESNQLNVKINEIDVMPLIQNLVQSFQLTVPCDKNVRIIKKFTEKSLLVKTDQLRLEQILRNLLSNAVKFTEEGIIEVSCQKGKEFFTFSVKDTGIGIHIEHQEMIFNRFIKIDNKKQYLHRGTGIGLFLSKKLVEMFGGKIWVESKIGEGSNFLFTIPVIHQNDYQ